MATKPTFIAAFNYAMRMVNASPDLEFTSALKQAAWDCGVWEDEMPDFVRFAWERLGVTYKGAGV